MVIDQIGTSALLSKGVSVKLSCVVCFQGGSSEVSAALPTSPTQGLVTGPSSQVQKGSGPQLPKSAPQVPTPKPALQQAAPKAGPQQAAPVQVTVQDQVRAFASCIKCFHESGSKVE